MRLTGPYFFNKTYVKPKILKTITSNNQPNIFYKQKKLTINKLFPISKKSNKVTCYVIN